jgi:hypothetical protein
MKDPDTEEYAWVTQRRVLRVFGLCERLLEQRSNGVME